MSRSLLFQPADDTISPPFQHVSSNSNYCLRPNTTQRKMWILPLVGYIGTLLGFCFLTLAIASGLYYLSELVEEHSVIAKRFLTRLIYSVIGIQTVLWLVDGLPFWATVLTIVSHVVYLGNMRRFPFVKLSDPLFLASCGMLPWRVGKLGLC